MSRRDVWSPQGYHRLDDVTEQHALQLPAPSITSSKPSLYGSSIYTNDEDTMYIPLRDITAHGDHGTDMLDSGLKPSSSTPQPPSRHGRFMRWWNRQFLGWRAGAMSCAVGSSVVFVVNLVVTIWATAKYDVVEGRSTLFNGSCDKMRPLNTFLHLLINILSTVLLSSSNYCMQCLSAPTRAEIDSAHAKGVWLDIGVPSFRNLRHISPLRTILWVALGFSSLPLHLFYNSAVYSSIAANEYSIYTVSEAFLNPPADNQTWVLDHVNLYEADLLNLHRMIKEGSPNVEALSRDDCIRAYAQDFVTNRASLIMPATDYNSSTEIEVICHSSSAVVGEYQVDPYGWICNQQNVRYSTCSSYPVYDDPCRDRISGIYTNSSGWRPFYYDINECYSEKTNEYCKIQFSLILAIVVIILNALKASIMFYLAYGVKENPLMTMGDGVASFLSSEDMFSRDMCLTSKTDITNSKYIWHTGPRRFQLLHRRWYTAASVKRWIACMSMFSFAFALVTFLFDFGRRAITGPSDIGSLAKLGLGEINPMTMISWEIPSSGASGLLANVLVANAAQPILSFMYFTYNGLFTSMFLSQEWNSYARVRKSLRVSTVPRGAQRDTYFLQLPYRIALPLMGASGFLHWLVSQSIFLVNVETYSYASQQVSGGNTTSSQDASSAQQLPVDNFMSCGYSPLAIVLVICATGLLIVGILAVGAKKFRVAMPVAASCSIAIAAACHPEKNTDRREDWTGEVMWGVMGKGHLGFSSREVGVPVEGDMYE